MPVLTWKDEYLLGVDHLDFEHRDLFACINDLCDKCITGRGSDDVEGSLGRLLVRLSAHFALEERTMREYKNPHYREHKAEHDRFLDEVTEAVAHFSADFEYKDMLAFAEKIHDWIVGHITTFDRQLVEKGP